jgi:hypothetical protein
MELLAYKSNPQNHFSPSLLLNNFGSSISLHNGGLDFLYRILNLLLLLGALLGGIFGGITLLLASIGFDRGLGGSGGFRFGGDITLLLASLGFSSGLGGSGSFRFGVGLLRCFSSGLCIGFSGLFNSSGWRVFLKITRVSNGITIIDIKQNNDLTSADSSAAGATVSSTSAVSLFSTGAVTTSSALVLEVDSSMLMVKIWGR